MGEFVRLEVADGIGTIRLDRPKMNALNLQVQSEIEECAREATVRDDVAAVIVYGGERVFAAGADIKEMQTMAYTDMAVAVEGLHSFTTTLARMPKPTVAAITGYALGGGCELAMCCDFRIAGESAQLGQPEILLGIIPGAGGTQRLTRLVGPAKAKDLIFSGRFIKADEALAIGLVDRLFPDAEVYAAAQAMMAPLVAGPRFALKAAKEAIDRGSEVDLDTGLALEKSLFSALFATHDRLVGMESFVTQGPGKAKFEGR